MSNLAEATITPDDDELETGDATDGPIEGPANDLVTAAKHELSIMRRMLDTLGKVPRAGQERVLTWLRSTIESDAPT